MTCIKCKSTNESKCKYCTNCGWPLEQLTPYPNKENCSPLPVTDFNFAPSRDDRGRPLAYVTPETGEQIGRAGIPGQTLQGVDKIPDFPSQEGSGGRRFAHLVSDPYLLNAISSIAVPSGTPKAAGFGAGRLVWVTDREIFEWDLKSKTPKKSSLPQVGIVANGKKILTHGYKTYVNGTSGLYVHDGLQGTIETVAGQSSSVSDMVVWRGKLVLCHLNGSVTVDGQTIPTEFAAVMLLVDGSLLAAVSKFGEVAILDSENQFRYHLRSNDGNSLKQAWTIDGRVFVRVKSNQGDFIRFATEEPEGVPRADAYLSSDTKVAAYNKSTGWENSRVVSCKENTLRFYEFAGSDNPRAEIVPTSPIGDHFYLVQDTQPNGSKGPLCVVYPPVTSGQGSRTLVVETLVHPMKSNSIQIPLHSLVTIFVPAGHCILVINYDNNQSVIQKLDLP